MQAWMRQGGAQGLHLGVVAGNAKVERFRAKLGYQEMRRPASCASRQTTRAIPPTFKISTDAVVAADSGSPDHSLFGTPPMPMPKPTLPRDNAAARALTRVLDQSEQIKEAVAECADDLSSVNSALKEELAQQPSQAGLGDALAKNEVVESKVQACVDDLSVVAGALKVELKERQVLEHELAAARAQERSARHAAFHDALTSLPNRVLFNDRLEHGLAQAKRHDWTLAVMFIDLDGFKAINDTHGHLAGDSVLQTIAGRLKTMTREDDTVSRHGGDEFLYLLLELKQQADAITVAAKIMATLGEPCEVTLNDLKLSLRVGCSIGIAMFPGDGSTVDTLVRSADRAMYRAKRDKSGYAFASALERSQD